MVKYDMIIGITGKKQSGKDTAANILVTKYGFIKYSFADHIKRACKEMFGFTDEQCWGDKKEVTDEHWGIKPREALQILGTECAQFLFPEKIIGLKKIGRYFWVHRFLQFYNQNQDKDIVIPDVRFLHEVTAIKKMGGLIFKIIRSSLKNEDTHISEMEMNQIKDIDFLFYNDSNIDGMHKEIIKKMEKIRGTDGK